MWNRLSRAEATSARDSTRQVKRAAAAISGDAETLDDAQADLYFEAVQEATPYGGTMGDGAAILAAIQSLQSTVQSNHSSLESKFGQLDRKHDQLQEQVNDQGKQVQELTREMQSL